MGEGGGASGLGTGRAGGSVGSAGRARQGGGFVKGRWKALKGLKQGTPSRVTRESTDWEAHGRGFLPGCPDSR